MGSTKPVTVLDSNLPAEPMVISGLPTGQSVCRLENNQFLDKVYGFERDLVEYVRGEVQICLGYVAKRLLLVLAPEGRVTRQEGVGEDAKTPHVCGETDGVVA